MRAPRKLIPFLVHWYLGLWWLNKIALAIVILALPLGPLAYFAGRPAYRNWKQLRMLEVAEASARRGQIDHAAMAFNKAVAAAPNNVGAWKKFGEFLDAQHSGSAVVVWERVAYLEPGQPQHRYRAAGIALKNGDWPRARTNLEFVSAPDRRSDAYRLLDAQTLLAAGHREEAGAKFAALVERQGPWGDAGFELDHLRLASSAEAPRTESEARMRKRADRDGPYTSSALRSLVAAETARGLDELAASDAGRLVQRNDSTGEDQVQFLELEFRTQSLSLPESIQKSLDRALRQPSLMTPVLAVLAKWGKGDTAETWLEAQSAEKLAPESIHRARVMLALANRDSSKTYALLAGGAQPMSRDAIEGLRRIQAEYDAGNAEALGHWKQALQESAGDAYRLYVMSSLAQAWGWKPAYELALWDLAEASPGNRAAWQQLVSIAVESGDTQRLLQAATGLAKAAPSLREARTLTLNLNFLLGRGDTDEMLRLAEADAAVSADPDVQLVYAALLTKAKRNPEAVAVADKISGSRALGMLARIYLGYVYAAAGQPEKARPWLVSDDTGSQKFLPEELDLARRATLLVQKLQAANKPPPGRQDQTIGRLLAPESASLLAKPVPAQDGIGLDNPPVPVR